MTRAIELATMRATIDVADQLRVQLERVQAPLARARLIVMADCLLRARLQALTARGGERLAS